jgi:hypothetical protein
LPAPVKSKPGRRTQGTKSCGPITDPSPVPIVEGNGEVILVRGARAGPRAGRLITGGPQVQSGSIARDRTELLAGKIVPADKRPGISAPALRSRISRRCAGSDLGG